MKTVAQFSTSRQHKIYFFSSFLGVKLTFSLREIRFQRINDLQFTAWREVLNILMFCLNQCDVK